MTTTEAAVIIGVTKSGINLFLGPMKSVGGKTWTRASHLVTYKAEVEKVKKKVTDLLLPKKTDIETIIEGARSELNTASEEAKKWISAVEEISKQVNDLVVECRGENPSAHVRDGTDVTQDRDGTDATQNGMTLESATKKKIRVKNPIRRMQIGALATKLLDQAEELLKRRNDLVVLVPCIRTPNAISPRNNVMKFSSRNEAVSQIMSALKEDNVHVIGVYGPSGIGKSLLVAEILELMMGEEKAFDEVLTVDLGNRTGLEEIRNSITKQLGIATDFLAKTLKEKRYVVFLDNAWESLDLGMLGIPVEQCKVIITTQKKGVCKNPYASVEITVDFLTEQESWELFKFKAGLAETYGTESVEQKIAKRCGRLPVALDVIGTALHGKDKMYWESALLELESSNRLEKDEVLQKIYNPLESSYDHLEGPGTKSLFLMCSLFPRLRCLQLFIKDVSVLSLNDQIFGIDFVRKLKSYIIYTELQWITLVKSHRKNLYLKGVTSVGDWVVDALLGETEDMILDNCFEEESTMLHFTALSCISTFRVLKILRLTNCNGLTHLVWCDDQKQSAFHNLEELHITKCDRLRSVFHFESINKKLSVFPCLKIIRLINLQETVSIWSWEGNPPHHICPNLKELNVQRCSKLDCVFVARVAAMLSNLERLTLKSNVALKEIVTVDYRMEEIVSEHVKMEEAVRNEIVIADTRYPAHPADASAPLDPEAFPSLTHLSLVDLPEMEYFYKVRGEIMRFSWKSLVSLKLGGCNYLKGFPIHGESAPGLKNVELAHDSDKTWYQTLISQDAPLAERFKTTQE